MKYFALLAGLLLSGCGAHHVIPTDDGKPQSITVSGYTTSGCLENLAEEAKMMGLKIKNIRVVSDSPALTVVFWPFIKGSSCAGDVQ